MKHILTCELSHIPILNFFQEHIFNSLINLRSKKPMEQDSTLIPLTNILEDSKYSIFDFLNKLRYRFLEINFMVLSIFISDIFHSFCKLLNFNVLMLSWNILTMVLTAWTHYTCPVAFFRTSKFCTYLKMGTA